MTEEIFVRRTRIARPAAEVFAWHERPGALQRLSPPWENVTVESSDGGIRDGAVTRVRTRIGPFSLRWRVVHRDYLAGVQFRDVQEKGPFAQWDHTHAIEPDGGSACFLVDTIRYRLPLGIVGRTIAADWVRAKLARAFRWRHEVTKSDLELLRDRRGERPKTIVVAGASGLIGRVLIPLLQTQGYAVRRLVRREAAHADEIRWDPAKGELDATQLGTIDAVINLSGENVAGGRWTKRRRNEIIASRIDATRTLGAAIGRLGRIPEVWINASAIGIYGDRGDEVLNETSAAGSGFLAEVVRAWEAEALKLAPRATRLVMLRFGTVLTPAGGALGKLLPLFRLGLGGPIGNGRQWFSWIAIDDAVGAIAHALADERCRGSINVVAPHGVTNAGFTGSLAVALQRPAFVRFPEWALRAGFGEMAQETVLASARVEPTALMAAGYVFRFPKIEPALQHVLGRWA
ncbi:MAG: hypothetical protein JWM32_1298 [Verrucomicrobia bacterium]|nr:hypothetical protein [Verrucomicrobiota bacterium]